MSTLQRTLIFTNILLGMVIFVMIFLWPSAKKLDIGIEQDVVIKFNRETKKYTCTNCDTMSMIEIVQGIHDDAKKSNDQILLNSMKDIVNEQEK